MVPRASATFAIIISGVSELPSLPPAPPLHIQWAAASEQLEEEVGQACCLQEERQHCFSDKGPATKLLRRPLTMPNEDGGE